MTTALQSSAVDWGSVPDWIAALGATSALIFAFLAVRATRKTNEYQAQQIEALERERIQSQASKVIASYRAGEAESNILYSIHNASDLPVFDALVFAYRDRTPRCLEKAFFLNNAPPGITESLPTQSAIDGGNRWIGMLFLDTGYHLWLRSFSGKLKQIDEQQCHDLIRIVESGPIMEPSSAVVEKFW